MKKISVFCLLWLLVGCAKGRLDVYDSNGKIVGECIARYDWHFYGIDDSVNYMLNLCAQQAKAEGRHIIDETILNTDFTLPPAPEGKSWNRKLAMFHYRKGNISEQKLGYILSDIEYKYALKERDAEAKLAQGKITQSEFDQIIKDGMAIWYGE